MLRTPASFRALFLRRSPLGIFRTWMFQALPMGSCWRGMLRKSSGFLLILRRVVERDRPAHKDHKGQRGRQALPEQQDRKARRGRRVRKAIRVPMVLTA